MTQTQTHKAHLIIYYVCNLYARTSNYQNMQNFICQPCRPQPAYLASLGRQEVQLSHCVPHVGFTRSGLRRWSGARAKRQCGSRQLAPAAAAVILLRVKVGWTSTLIMQKPNKSAARSNRCIVLQVQAQVQQLPRMSSQRPPLPSLYYNRNSSQA